MTEAAAPAPAPAPPALAWLPEADADTVGYVQNKAWQGPADMLTGYRNLEKMVGADRAGRTVVLPAEETPEAWNTVYDRLGRPTTPADYKLPVPDGVAPDFANAAAAEFHKLGLSAKQGQALAAWWNEQSGGAATAAAAAEQAALAAEHQSLAKDWGEQAPVRRELAKRASVALGLDESAIDALEKATGFSKTLKALAKIGDMLGEHKAEGFDQPGSFGLTPEGAKSKRSQLMADADWRKRASTPNSKEWADLMKLDSIIAAAQA